MEKRIIREETKKGRVFLVETNVETQNRLEFEPNGNYALGLAYLEAVLKKEGYQVIAKDFAPFGERFCISECIKIINTFNPEVIGISVMSMTRVSTYKLIKIIKEINPQIKIILGGVHSSLMYSQLLENFPIDCVVIGEAEETIKELIPALLGNKRINQIKGIAFKEKEKIIKTEFRELIKDVDKIPFPIHETFMNPQRTKICILSSRGCPFKCSFCALYSISKRKYRMRSPKNVVEEIEETIKKFPKITSVEFSDDTFTLNPERVVEFCKEILKRKIKVDFLCSARIKPMTEEMLYWMQRAGFTEIRFGIETGSRKLLESIHKNITPEEVVQTFKICSKFPKIKFVKFLMVGFPGENEETIRETIDLTKKIQKLVPMDFFMATPLWVYPGTEVYEKMKEAGKIDDSYWLTDKECPHYTVEHTQEELFSMAQKIAFETTLARGKIYFLKLVLKKIVNQPKREFKRIKSMQKRLIKKIFGKSRKITF